MCKRKCETTCSVFHKINEIMYTVNNVTNGKDKEI